MRSSLIRSDSAPGMNVNQVSQARSIVSMDMADAGPRILRSLHNMKPGVIVLDAPVASYNILSSVPRRKPLRSIPA